MKKLHLVCNSHLDPVWQWDWDEGASAALATFYSALRQEDLDIYCSQPSQAKQDIIRKAEVYENDKEDDVIILWGVGNHGGVNSEKDLNDIMSLMDEKKGTMIPRRFRL